jgi:hypothetical protein
MEDPDLSLQWHPLNLAGRREDGIDTVRLHNQGFDSGTPVNENQKSHTYQQG